MGNVSCIDLMIHDGLWDPYNNCHMGVFAEKLAAEYGYTRAELDEFSAESYRRALKAIEEGIFNDEVVPVEIVDKKGNVTVIDQDEEPKRVDFAKMPKLKPAFKSDGVITAANASSINDGAGAVVITTPERAKKYGSEILGYIVGQSTASQPPEWFTTAPVASIEKLLQKIGWKKEDVGLWEINEAFSDVTLHAIRTLGLDHKKVNIYGGAVAIGHPIGASGARILVTLLYAMKRLDVKRGIASLCIGGGEAISMAIERK
jgi:acetyl-CoA C-acetyltransferase